MALENTYIINLDLKRGMTSTTPTFRHGDNAILIFELFDDGIEYLIDDSTRVELRHESPTGIISVISANFTTYNGRKTVKFNYINQSLLESGIYKATLVIYRNQQPVSFQPFPVVIYSEGNSSSTLVDLLKEINNDISNAMLSLKDAIMLSEKGVPNGVATLDANGKIPISQMPDGISNFETHINTLIWNVPVHGMRITKPDTDPDVDAGIAQYYVPEDNKWQNFGFAPDATGGGGGATALVDVSIEKSDGIVTVTYTGVPTVVLQKWDYGEREVPYFATNGTVFTGNSFEVDKIGLYTLYYKDSNGTEYVKVFNITASDLATPTIDVEVENGDVTVTISQPTTIKKWAKGQQGIPYFQSQGNVFTGNMFTVTEVGWYTIYYKVSSGAEYIYQFQVYGDMIGSPISDVPQYTEIRFGDINAIVLNPEEGLVLIKDYSLQKFDSNGNTSFNANRSSNVGYYLNNTFLDLLLSKGVKESDIINKTWGIGALTPQELGYSNSTPPTLTPEQMRVKEMTTTTNAKIGLLSGSQYREYHSYYNNNGRLEGVLGYTMTPHIYNGVSSNVWASTFSNGVLGGINPTDSARVYPVFYLNSNVKFFDGQYVPTP